ncbi:MAG: HEAT repeat domain-containing protein [Planctomycetaceae bacterium]|nr:HEAT repeat domain-containing protein [Planctomycetaceae bacterium]
MIRKLFLCGILTAISSHGSVCADEKVGIKGGGSVVGKTNPNEKFVEVNIAPGVRVALDSNKAEIAKEERPEEAEYIARLEKLAETADAHWEMYQWCKQNSLTSYAYQHAWRAIEINPDHQQARMALDFQRDGKGWILRDDLMLRSGRIKDGAQWRIPEELERNKAEQARTEQVTRWKRDIKAWKTDFYSGGPRAGRSKAKLDAIQDPVAVGPLIEQLKDGDNPPEFRILVVGLLSRIGTPNAIQALIEASVEDSSSKVREAALDVVKQKAPEEAASQYARLLSHESNTQVQRAGNALAVLQDKRYTWHLIQALVTEHKREVKGSGQTYGQDSAGGFAIGGSNKPKVVMEPVNNAPVLTALTAMYPDVNYRFDESRWKVWYLENFHPEGTDLRRDP